MTVDVEVAGSGLEQSSLMVRDGYSGLLDSSNFLFISLKKGLRRMRSDQGG